MRRSGRSGIEGPGFALDGYRDLAEIGRGGSSVVFRAWQIDFNRWVAIKVVRIGSGTTPLSQFRRERMAIGMLSGHPNIVTVHDAGIRTDGSAYIVMEHLPDGTFADRLRTEAVGWQEAVMVGVSLCGALESAHRAGVLHLDVKPENVFLARDLDTVKLGDFGIARIRESAPTRARMISGTLLHIAPERLRDEPPTAASDVYSLGSTLFTLVAGRPPFGCPDEADGVVMARLLVDRPPVPDLGGHGLPAPFCRIVEAALAPDPADRPATAGELGEQLRAAQAEEGLVPTPMVVRVGPAPPPPPVPAGSLRPVPSAETLPPTPTPVDVADEDADERDRPGGGPPPVPPPRSRRVRPAVTAVVVLLVVSATVAGWASGVLGPSDDDGGIPTTSAAATVPAATAPTPPVYGDDFSDPESGWAKDAAGAGYDAGAYRINVPTAPSRLIVAAPAEDPEVQALARPGTTTRLEVDVRFVDPEAPGGAGLYCRRQPDTRDRYQAVVFPDGFWQITKDGKDDPIVKLASGRATLLGTGDGYRLRFDCGGAGGRTTLRLEVGGALVGEAVDEDGLDGGGVGMVAVATRAPGIEALFDNFLATSP